MRASGAEGVGRCLPRPPVGRENEIRAYVKSLCEARLAPSCMTGADKPLPCTRSGNAEDVL